MDVIVMAFELFNGLPNLWKALITAYIASGIAFVSEMTMFGKNVKRGFRERFSHSILYVSGLLIGVTLSLMFPEDGIFLLKSSIVTVILLLVEDVDEVARSLGVKLIPDSLKRRLRAPKDAIEEKVDKAINKMVGTKDKDEE